MAANVQVVLKQDVDNLGATGQVVRVKPGYARNFLLPRGLAVMATRGNVKQVEHERKLALGRAEKARSVFVEQAAQLEKVVVMIPKEVGEEGRLFGSVTASEIADAIEAKGVEFDRKKLQMPDEAIKQVGTYEIPVKLGMGVIAKIKVEVKTKS
jgi:large subunit ribosomal protein L9